MSDNTPQANAAPPVPPTQPAAQQAPPPQIHQATPVQGTPQPQVAPAPRRNRNPRGPVPAASSGSSAGIPALLELAAAMPMSTVQRRVANLFVPDAHHLFLVLSQMDAMMSTTHRFLQSSPAWIPIVSHLYISVLWLVQIIKVYVNSGYGFEFGSLLRDIEDYLNIGEAMVPGPLVPFFESLAAVSGPFDWFGDILPALPAPNIFWPPQTRHPSQNFLRQVPVPFIILDQLAAFAQVTDANAAWTTFEWYRNICQLTGANVVTSANNRLAPQSAASLFVPQAQHEAARAFWSRILPDDRFTRWNFTNAANSAPVHWAQILGFTGQDNATNIDWFQQVTIVMQKYCAYFNGSRPLKMISPTGIGAVAVSATIDGTAANRNWLYPERVPAARKSNEIVALHPLPATMRFNFTHADHDAEEIAEQYAITSHININWMANNAAQNNWTRIDAVATHSGSYWTMTPHREANAIRIRDQYAQIVASRYHQSVALKSE